MVFKQIWENDIKEIVICKINEYFITFTEHVHWIKAAYSDGTYFTKELKNTF